ncbi:MAG: Fic family protein [Gammaproteobacteria bacterium]
MEKHDDILPEILISSGKDARTAQAISRLVRSGRARKLAPKIYTTNFAATPETLVRRHIFEIAGSLYPEAVVSHRTALEAGPTADGSLYLTYKHSRNVALPGHTLRLLKGPGALPGDRPFIAGLHIASEARAMLENLAPARARAGAIKVLPRETIEDRLDRICKIRGENALNRLREQARTLSERGGWNPELARLDALVGAILGSRSARGLKSKAVRARALGKPYDAKRIDLFNRLFQALRRHDCPHRPAPPQADDRETNRAFFEAYFSNYIEGTRFEIEEARQIVLEGRVFDARVADSHDILGTFRVVSDPADCARVPQNFEDFTTLATRRHEILLAGRPQIRPGQFKEQVNRAGSTVFVAPELARATLEKGYALYRGLDEPFARAAFIMFLIAEVHPFTDGNGRLARVMMNAELSAAGKTRIIIPTVYRDDYLGTLRLLSRQAEPDAYIRMLARAHAFSASFDFTNYQTALAQLDRSNAFLEPAEGTLRFS